MQRGQGNQAAANAARSLRRRLLQRSFGSLQNDLGARLTTPVRVIVPTEVAELDALWKAGMKGLSPLDFVLRAIQDVPAPPHQRLYLKFDLTGGGKAVSFDLKFQETKESAKRPDLPEGQPLTRGWAQYGPSSWYRNVAGATRTITFGETQLDVQDQRTDAPVGKEGGSGFTKRLFKNLLEMYAAASPRTVMTITADEEGRYVWARYGFLPNADEWKGLIRKPIIDQVAKQDGGDLATKLLNCAQVHGTPIAPGAAKAMAAALERDDPLALFDLVDIREAQKFLWWLFTSGIVGVWHGTLDLAHAVQGPRVRQYVGLPEPAKTPTITVVESHQ